MGKNIGKNTIKNLSDKYRQKRSNYAKQSATDLFKAASRRTIVKTEETPGDLIGNKIANKITKASRTLPQNNSETVKNEDEDTGRGRKIPRERYISPENKQKINDNLRLI